MRRHMMLLLTLTILILSIGVVSANSNLYDANNLNQISDSDNFYLETSNSNFETSNSNSELSDTIENNKIITPIDSNQFSDEGTDPNPEGDDPNGDDPNGDDPNGDDPNPDGDENDGNGSTGVITPEINDTINGSDISPGKLSGKTYINITNLAFEEEEIGYLPISFDLRDYGFVTPVKDQAGSGSCWAFASTAALESFLLKTEGVEYDFSENNMKNIMGSYSPNGTDYGPNDGGNEVLILAYYLRWSGPVNETDDPYNDSSTRSPTNLTAEKYVQDVLLVPRRQNALDNDQIKMALMTYGALYTGIYWDSSYEKGESYYYYGTYPYGNHAITIVGWDDTYSKNNFRSKPEGDGAFIIKNSWGVVDKYGNEVGKEGYYYVSYYDKVFAGRGSNEYFSAMAFTGVENTSYYKSNYYYDVYGNTFDAVGYKNETAWFANQFISESNNPLKAVGFYSYGSSDYEVYIYVNNSFKYKQTGSLKGAGYHTVKLDKMVNLYAGDKFRINVKLVTPNCDYPIAIETYHSGFTSKAKAEANQSFVSSNGIAWEDLTTVSGYKNANVCLKAYTSYAADLNIETSSNVTYYSEGEEVELSVNITNMGDSSSAQIYSSLDENVKIVSYETTNGVFDPNTKIWTIEDLAENSSNILKIVIQINTRQSNITNSFLVNTSLYNMNQNSSSLDLLRRISANLSSKALTTDYKSGEFFDVKIVNEDMEAISDAEVRFEVYDSDNQLIGTYYNTTDDNGEAYLATGFDAGDYSVKISLVDPLYEGQMIGTILVLKANTSLNAIEAETVLNKSTILTANVLNDYGTVNEGIVKFYVDGLFAGSALVQEGIAYIEYRHDKVGSFNITASYDENENYLKSEGLSTLEVEKITASLKSEDIVSVYKDFNSYNVSVLDEYGNGIQGINVLFNIYQDGNLLANNYILTNDKGLASLNMDLTAGDYTVEVILLDDEFKGNKNNTILINKATAKLTAKQIGNSLDNSSLVISFKQAITNKAYGNEKILLSFSNGKLYSLTTDENGQASLKLDIGGGRHTYQLNSANNNIIAKSAGVVEIEKSDAKLDIEPIALKYGDDGELTAKLTDLNNNPLENIELIFMVEGQEIAKGTDANGIAKLDLRDLNGTLLPNTYKVTVKSDDASYNINETISFINVLKINSMILASIEDKEISSGGKLETYAYSNETIKFKLLDEFNNPIGEDLIYLTLDKSNEIHILNTGSNGTAEFTLNLPVNSYVLDVRYLGNAIYDEARMSLNLTVNKRDSPTIISNDEANVTEAYEISLVDNESNPIANETLKVIIYDEDNNAVLNTTAVTDENGTAKIEGLDKLDSGNYSVELLLESNLYNESISRSNITIVSNNTDKKDSDIQTRQRTRIICENMITESVLAEEGRTGEYFHVKLVDANNNPLANKAIKIGFNGAIYNRTTNASGEARLQINLRNPMAYTFAICFLGDDDYYGAFDVALITVNKKAMSLNAPEKTYKSSAKSKVLTATLKDKKGNAIKNRKIQFVLDGKTYTANTNENGLASVKVSLSTKKTYSFTVKFAGDNYCSAVSTKAKLSIV